MKTTVARIWLAALAALAAFAAAPLAAASIDERLATHPPQAPLPVLLRRLSLDLTGQLPDRSLTDAALASPPVLDLDRETERMLASPEFAQHWGRVVQSWITAGIPAYQPIASRSLARWIARELARGTPMDALVRELVSARGSALEHPAVSYLLQLRDTRDDLAGHLARTFLGARIQCAQCHDHPFAAWKKEDFRGFASVFAQVRVTQWPRALLERVLSGETVTPVQYMAYMPPYVRHGFRPGGPDDAKVRETIASFTSLRNQGSTASDTLTVETFFEALQLPRSQRGELTPGTFSLVLDTRTPAPGEVPRFLDGTHPAGPARLRESLAAWIIASPDRRWARCLVNRVWKELVGRGLVEPVDDLDGPDDARFARLLDELAADWVAEGCQLRPLVRRIVSAAVYRSGASGEAPADATFAFQHALARPLRPEVLARCVLQATGRAAGATSADLDRAATLQDELARTLRTATGVPAERLALTLQNALYLTNGPPVNQAVVDAAGPALPEELVRRALCRHATPAEQAAIAARFAQAPEPVALADVLWALCTSVEFQEVF